MVRGQGRVVVSITDNEPGEELVKGHHESNAWDKGSNYENDEIERREKTEPYRILVEGYKNKCKN